MSDTLKIRLAELARTHGQRGIRLLVLFQTIKPLALEQLNMMRITVDENELNQACLEKANELLLSERNVNSEHIIELVRAIRTKTLEQYRTPSQTF